MLQVRMLSPWWQSVAPQLLLLSKAGLMGVRTRGSHRGRLCWTEAMQTHQCTCRDALIHVSVCVNVHPTLSLHSAHWETFLQ